MTIPDQIARVKAALLSAKPRSRRKVELESRLRELVLRQIKWEIQKDRRQ